MNMIERVARALCLADGKNPDAPCKISTCGGEVTMLEWQYHYPFAAMRAIEAMREPTQTMRDGFEANGGFDSAYHTDLGDFQECWAGAIDAALK